MKIIPIFDIKRKPEKSTLWSVCYEEDKENGHYVDIFDKLFQWWNDVGYLSDFFNQNEVDLANPFWNNMTKEDAINKVLDEAGDFLDELMATEYKVKGYENVTIKDLFESFHKNEFLIKPRQKREKDFRKGKPLSFIRCYDYTV